MGSETQKTEGTEAKPAEGEKPADKPAETPALDIKALKAPEGVTLDPEALAAFEPLAKELGLSQEGAQKLLDTHTSVLQKTMEAPYRAWEKTQTEWQSAVKADAEVGGDKWDTTLATINKAIAPFATEGFKAALSLTGAGNNPEIVKTLARMSKALTEGGLVGGNPPSKAATPMGASALYPNLKAE